MAPWLSGDGEQDMKGILHIWKRQTFARQLTMVFMGVFLFQMVIVQGLSSSYMRRFMKEKIEESYQLPAPDHPEPGHLPKRLQEGH